MSSFPKRLPQRCRRQPFITSRPHWREKGSLITKESRMIKKRRREPSKSKKMRERMKWRRLNLNKWRNRRKLIESELLLKEPKLTMRLILML
jgi:hypothetical protein